LNFFRKPAELVKFHQYLTSITRTLHEGKGKAVPLQAWSGPEGSRKLRFPDFMTNGTGG